MSQHLNKLPNIFLNLDFAIKDKLHIDSDMTEAMGKKKWRIKGLANANVANLNGIRIEPSAFNTKIFETNPIMFLNHDRDKAIGTWHEWSIDNKGLHVIGEIGEGFEPADTVRKQVEQGIIRTLSIGGAVKDGRVDEESEEIVVTELLLFEISVVTLPNNTPSLFTITNSNEMQPVSKEFFRSQKSMTVDNNIKPLISFKDGSCNFCLKESSVMTFAVEATGKEDNTCLECLLNSNEKWKQEQDLLIKESSKIIVSKELLPFENQLQQFETLLNNLKEVNTSLHKQCAEYEEFIAANIAGDLLDVIKTLKK